MSVTLIKSARQSRSGYAVCACRDCMDTTVHSDVTSPELCSECADAGCEPWRTTQAPMTTWYGAVYDCQRDDAYGE